MIEEITYRRLDHLSLAGGPEWGRASATPAEACNPATAAAKKEQKGDLYQDEPEPAVLVGLEEEITVDPSSYIFVEVL